SYADNMQSSDVPLLPHAPENAHRTVEPDPSGSETTHQIPRKFARGLNLFDSTMFVVGAMIGSGIFIVPADMARHLGSAGWLLVAWGLAGVLTIAGALCYGELSAMMPHAGGMYVYLREAYSPLSGFLYGWTLFAVIETGTIADRKSTRLNSSHGSISYAVFCLKKKKTRKMNECTTHRT